ncbi:hypothetical protein XANCAGTX0491_008950 [Xanthoria calcicola]
MDSIDPSLRDHAQAASQASYPSLPPSNYPLNPIRLPPPQQHPNQQHPTQQHQSPQHPHPWPSQSDSNLYYAQRASQHAQTATSIHHDASANQPDQSTPDSKRPRACEACRGLKVRCEPDPVKGACRRCAKAGRHCVVTAPSRKRQKKTDSRVAELEKKIDALTASLHATKAQGMSDSDDESADDPGTTTQPRLQLSRDPGYLPQEEQRSANTANMVQQRPSDTYNKPIEPLSYQPAMSNDRKRRMSQYLQEESALTGPEPQSNPINVDSPIRQSTRTMSETSHMRPSQHNGTVGSVLTTSHSASPTHEYADVVDRKVLDATLATELFEHYTRNMAKHMPLVMFAADTPAGAIRKHRPILFLAILSVASGQEHPDIQRILAKDIMRTFADRIVYRGEKSLELIQALQVLTIWYWPEENRDAQTYQLIHMAAVMAIDLGLGRRAKGSREPYHAIWKDQPRPKSSAQASETLEMRRAWLGCYLLCANAAMGLRRTNLIRWGAHMDDCLDFLNTSPEALPSDSVLVEWVRLQRLADDVGNQISVDESSSLGISDVKTQYALKGFERQMKDWEKQASKQVTSPSLTFNFHIANLYMHEFAMHLDQALEFPGSSHEREAPDGKSPARAEVLTTAHIGALTTCLTSIHGLFDTFLHSTTDDVRTVPVFYFVRIAYATVLLIKLHLAASAPESELGKVISTNDLRVEDYLRRLRELLQAGAGSGKCRPARSFFLVLVMLQTWFERQRDGKGSLADEVEHSKRGEGQPVDVDKRRTKSEYKRMQLNGSSPPGRRSSTATTAAPVGLEGMDQSRLHVLGEVALGNSKSNGHTLNQASDNWNAYAAGTLAGSGASGYVNYDYGAAVAGGPYEVQTHEYQPGLEQAIGMTFNEGNLGYMDDYALYNMMQMPNMLENMT